MLTAWLMVNALRDIHVNSMMQQPWMHTLTLCIKDTTMGDMFYPEIFHLIITGLFPTISISLPNMTLTSMLKSALLLLLSSTFTSTSTRELTE